MFSSTDIKCEGGNGTLVVVNSEIDDLLEVLTETNIASLTDATTGEFVVKVHKDDDTYDDLVCKFRMPKQQFWLKRS